MGSKNKKTQAAHERATLTSVVNMVKERDLNNFFGFTFEETERFCRAFQSLEQNSDTSFPDFYGDSSCIELFRISSSKPAKNGGSSQMKQDGKLKAKVEEDALLAASEPTPMLRTYRGDMHPRHSYEDLTRSLRSQCLKHLESLRKCSAQFETSAFVIECNEVDLQCAFAPAENAELNGLRFGDLFPTYEDGRQRGLYRLSRDVENLFWLETNLPEVDFIVFKGFEHIEAINHHRADALAAFLPWRLVSAWAPSMTTVTSIYPQHDIKELQRNE